MTDQKLHRLCARAEVNDESIRRVQAPGYEPLAVCRANGAYYVIADTCTHGLASLSEGEIYEGQVICPFHGGAFNVATGEATERPCVIPISTYPVIERGDSLYIAAKGSGSDEKGTQALEVPKQILAE